MKNQTNQKDPNNGGLNTLPERLRSIWLGRQDSNLECPPAADALPLNS